MKALIALAVSRWSGEDHALIVDVLNLRPANHQGAIGCYIQCRPVPVRFGPAPTLKTALAATRRAVTAASRIDRPPPQAVFDTLSRGGVSINLRAGPASNRRAPSKVLGLTVELADLPKRFKKSEMTRDLAFSLYLSPKGLRGALYYAGDRFSEAQIKALIADMRAILEAGLAAPC
jgi:hypothetical protein